MPKILQKIKYLLILPFAFLFGMLTSCMAFDSVKEINIVCNAPNNEIIINSFNYEDYLLEVTYQSGKKEILTLIPDMIVDYDRLSFYKAGNHTINVEYGRKQTSFDITVLLNTFSDEIKFEEKYVTYTGQPVKMEVVGDLPEGTKVFYKQGNEFTNAAIYDLEATLVCEGYNIKTLKSKLTIAKAEYDLSEIKFEDVEYTYDGTLKDLSIEGNLPAGLEVSYEIESYDETIGEKTYTDGNQATNAGQYDVRAIFTNKNVNYKDVAPKVAKMTINKATYDLSNFILEDKEITFDGEYHTIDLTANNPDITMPGEIYYSIEYNDEMSYLGVKDVGKYKVVAKFETYDPNHTVMESMESTFTINPAVIDMSSIIFDSNSFKYEQGVEHSIYCSADKENCPDYMYREVPNFVRFLGYTDDLNVKPVKLYSKEDAGIYNVYACFECTDSNHVMDSNGIYEAVLEITPIVLNIEGILFENRQYVYDGTEKSLQMQIIDGYQLPEFVNPVITGNNKIDAGIYEVNLELVSTDTNYTINNSIFNATLEINKLEITLPVTFEHKIIAYDGQIHYLEFTGTIPEEYGITYSYIGNDGFSDVGTYSVTLKFSCSNPNIFITNEVLTAALVITEA